jgi:hypothetical protein
MTNAVIITGILAGVPVVKILKIGVKGQQIQIEKMMLPVKKFFLTVQVMGKKKMVAIMRRLMKGTVIFLDRGTPDILRAVVQEEEVHLIIFPQIHRSYLLHLDTVAMGRKVIAQTLQVLTEGLHLLQAESIVDLHAHSILVYFLTGLVVHLETL